MRGAAARSSAWSEAPEERRAEKAGEAIDQAAAATTLRAARASGVFLHEVLERVPVASFGAGDVDTWRTRPDVAGLFDEALAAHRVDRAQREHAEQLVWSAYTTALALPASPGGPSGGRIDGLATASRLVREMDFVFPIPEDAPSVEPPRDAGPSPVRGYVRGSLDLAFEHRGVTYFVDWKSDSLRDYAPEALGRHVREHYQDQVALYALAVAKLLGVRTREEHDARFGGLLYLFLRGLHAGGAGVWAARPGWDDLVAWEAALRARRYGVGAAGGAGRSG
jgi:exodeoxyribonuclease V beta subunit